MERKFATVLFVDLVGSTSLLTRTDPEVFRRRIRSFLDEVRACVEMQERHEPFVERHRLGIASGLG